MQFGVFLPHQLPRPWSADSERALFQQSLEQAIVAERAGIDVVWGQEHHFLEEYSHSSAPEVYLAAIAARTSTIRIGYGVMLMPPGFNAPFRCAERVATLDVVSGGRVEWGTGASASRMELDGFGIGLADKRDMWAESVREVARMLALDPYPGYEGRYFSAPARNVVPKPLQRPHPPLWAACANRESVKEAARLGMGALTFAFTDAGEARFWVEEYYETFKRECSPIGASVNPSIAMLTNFMCHPDRDEAIRRGQRGAEFFAYGLAHFYRFGAHVPGGTRLWEGFQETRSPRLAGLGGIGTPEDLRGYFRGFEEAGVDQLIVLQQAGDYAHEHVCESLDLFGREVLPELRAREEARSRAKREELAPYVARAMERARVERARREGSGDRPRAVGPVRAYPLLVEERLRAAPATARGRTSIGAAMWALNVTAGRETGRHSRASAPPPAVENTVSHQEGAADASLAERRPPSRAVRAPAPRETLVSALERHVERRPDATAFTFGSGSARRTVTFATLARRARAIAAVLQERGAARGDTVLLTHASPLDLITAFFGCVYAGAAPVPAYPPRAGRNLRRLSAVATDARSRFLLTDTTPDPTSAPWGALGPGAGTATWLDTTRIADDAASAYRGVDAAPGALCFLQYTSGSTRRPRGVMVTHENLIANQHMLAEGLRGGEDPVFACWLPLFHDLGLVGHALAAIYQGAPCHLMSPEAFVEDPIAWLDLVTSVRATISGGPNFAYDLCVRRLDPARKRDLDLGSWRTAINGAEPVRDRTLRGFERAFRDCGFAPSAFVPSFGMSEATAFVSGGGTATSGRTLHVRRAEAERHAVVLCAPADEDAVPLVGCGAAGAGLEIAIVDPGTHEPCAAGRAGEIWVAGASVAAGYWHRERETEETFHARTSAGEGPYLRTGDLGFLHEGELFVSGRIKDVIIVRGRNIHPQDVEEIVESAHPLVRPGCAAAFGWESGGEERIGILFEPRSTEEATEETFAAACESIRGAVARELELTVAVISLVPPRTLPKTSSGKLQRSLARDALRDGALREIHRSVLGGDAGARDDVSRDDRRSPARGGPSSAFEYEVEWVPVARGDSDAASARAVVLIGEREPFTGAVARAFEAGGARCTLVSMAGAARDGSLATAGLPAPARVLVVPPAGQSADAAADALDATWTLLERGTGLDSPAILVTRGAQAGPDGGALDPAHAGLWALTSTLLVGDERLAVRRIDLDPSLGPEDAARALVDAMGASSATCVVRGGRWLEPVVTRARPPRGATGWRAGGTCLVCGDDGRAESLTRWLLEGGEDSAVRVAREPLATLAERLRTAAGGGPVRATFVLPAPATPSAAQPRDGQLRDALAAALILRDELRARDVERVTVVLSAGSLLGAPGAEMRAVLDEVLAAALASPRTSVARIGPWAPDAARNEDPSASIAELDESAAREAVLRIAASPGSDRTVVAAELERLLGLLSLRAPLSLHARLAARGSRPHEPGARSEAPTQHVYRRRAGAAPLVAPRDALEGTIAGVFRSMLNIDAVSVHDSFSDLGGDSMLTAEASVVLGHQLGVKLSMSEHDGPMTVASLADQVRRLRASGERPAVPAAAADSGALVEDGIWYAPLAEGDIDAASRLLSREFMREPMSASVGLTEERFMPFAGFYCRRAVGEGVSFVARKGRDGPIVGVGISGDLQAELSVEPPAAPEMAPIFQILDRLTADYLKMERDVGRVLHMNLAAVTRESEGRLIGQRLVQLTLQRARSLGYREAIGHIAARSLQLLFQHAFSFRELSRVEYATFEHEGARVFAHIRSPEAVLLLGRDLDGEVEAAPAGALP